MLSLRIIDNKEKRLDILRPLLDFLVSNQIAKFEKGLYIVKTELLCDPNRSREEFLFYSLQTDSRVKGFTYNCFNFNNA